MRFRGKAALVASSALWLSQCASESAGPAAPSKPFVSRDNPATAAAGQIAQASTPTGTATGTAGAVQTAPSAVAGSAGTRPGSVAGSAANGGTGVQGSSAGSGGSAGLSQAGAAGSSAGASPVAAAGAGSGGSAPVVGAAASCAGLPAVSDYSRPGPFADAKMFAGVGPNNHYHLYRPDASLGRDGFKHPIATWGNGIATTPDQYQQTLTLIASHGFVVIACDDTQAERACLSAGLDWLIEQNSGQGELGGKLDVGREVAIGYSWGGGAAIDTSDRPNIQATISLHGMPPREADAFDAMHSPLLLFTSTGDSFVTASGYVTPNYEKSKVQTFYATLADTTAGHLYVVDTDAVSCVASSALGDCHGAEAERAPVVAWLRYWVCGDQGAKPFFFGDDCVLCKDPWTMPQRKLWP